MKHQRDLKMMSVVNLNIEEKREVLVEDILGVGALATLFINFDRDHIEEYNDMVATLYSLGTSYTKEYRFRYEKYRDSAYKTINY